MARLIVGRFDNVGDASRVLKALPGEGFAARDYGVFYVTPPGQHALYPIGGDAHSDEGAKDAGGGAALGAAVGGAAGLAIGAAAAVALPIAGLAALLAGTGVGAYVGALRGGLGAMRRPDEAEATPEHPVEQPGGLRVAVRVDGAESEARAKEVLERLGALDIGEAEGEWHQGQWHDFDPRVPPAPVER